MHSDIPAEQPLKRPEPHRVVMQQPKLIVPPPVAPPLYAMSMQSLLEPLHSSSRGPLLSESMSAYDLRMPIPIISVPMGLVPVELSELLYSNVGPRPARCFAFPGGAECSWKSAQLSEEHCEEEQEEERDSRQEHAICSQPSFHALSASVTEVKAEIQDEDGIRSVQPDGALSEPEPNQDNSI